MPFTQPPAPARPRSAPAAARTGNESAGSSSRRSILVVLASAGLIVAGYLTLFQLHAFDDVWDPLFHSRPVLELTAPVPDALAGVLAYAAELGLLWLGSRDRWRGVPWVDLALGALLVTGTVVSIALIVIQPTVADAWCTLCLVSAALSFALFALGIGEARTAWQRLNWARAHGATLAEGLRRRPTDH
jgi:Vitamin K epoxide reductase family